jgi:hypothetical protein
MSKGKTVIFWGLIVIVAYLYAYEILWAVGMVPAKGNIDQAFYYRTSIENPAVWLRQALWLLSFPSAQMLYRWIPDEPYTKEMVYSPFGVAVQWFGYGCLFGLWRYKRRTKSNAVVQV